MNETLQHMTALLGHSEEDFKILRQVADKTRPWADEVVKMFYDSLFGYGPSREIFDDGERPAREETLRNWYLEVAGGELRSNFWQHQWIVGLVHIQRRVSNPFMIAMMSRVQELFLGKCLEELDAEQAQRVYGAFKRITDLVTGLIAEGYHQGYTEAVADVSGMKGALIDRMASVAVTKLLERARAEA